MKPWCYLIACNFFFVVAVTDESPSTCLTPNNEEALCISLFDCPVLLEASRSKDPLARKFIENSTCGEGNLLVCCGTLGYLNIVHKPKSPDEDEEPTKLSREYVIENLLPSKVYCGLQHTDDYRYTGAETSVDEFPWMVYIPSIERNEYYSDIDTNCAGVLINDRYVLTDKSCTAPLKLALADYNTRIIVKIGQHRVYNDVSCIETPYLDAPLDCTSSSLYEFIEDYISSDTSNIVLLRLEKSVDYNDFVRPICLPIEEPRALQTDETVLTSGWGEDQYTTGKEVKRKKRTKHTVMSKEECELANPVVNPLCGMTWKNSTSFVCPGDNGGPLMARYPRRKWNWVAVGIVTGTKACAKRQPVVAEKITPEVLDWIIDNIKP